MFLSSLLLAVVAQPQGEMLVTGKMISPIGRHVNVGSHPINMLKTADGKFAVVTNIGFRQFLSVVRISDGKVTDQIPFGVGNARRGQRDGLYYGLTQGPDGTLYVSRGAQDEISQYTISPEGKLTAGAEIEHPKREGRTLPNHPAGIAASGDGQFLVIANNQTGHQEDYKGSATIFDLKAKTRTNVEVGGFPFAVALPTTGPGKNQKAYVASERDGQLDVIHLRTGKRLRTVKVGTNPLGLTFNKDETRLYVANSDSDTLSVINTATDKVIQTVLLRPADLRGVPGAGPNSIALSPDEKTLYVTLSDMNAIAVVDAKIGDIKGMIPTGWLPTGIIVGDDEMLVASAKGVQAKNPNHKPVGELGQYGPNIIEGTVTRIPFSEIKTLKPLSDRVIRNNRIARGLETGAPAGWKNPGIEHVIYVVKENRTYDNVLGDLPRGNGDPSICLFPREVTPNQHALAERFVLLDNFYVCGEVSHDGWAWSTAGMVNAYASRNTPYNYSGRGRNYDTEGSNNGVPIDLIGIRDVTTPPNGYIWDAAARAGVSYRNFGMFSQFSDNLDKRFDVLKDATDNDPTKKALVGKTSPDFRRYDLSYADSEIYQAYNWNWPRQRKTFGRFNAPSRYSAWKKEFDEFVAKGEMPRLQLIRLGQDHTSGTAVGQPTPRSMVADNDYAVGELVEAVSKSPFWKNTVIIILEDDAQAGFDHVDSHRSICFVVSPFVERSKHDSRFYNTDSALRTIGLLLGMKPLTQYDAVATPFLVWTSKPLNIEPFESIMPAREIVCQANEASAYRSKDSEAISFDREADDEDLMLNDILWHSIMGEKTPVPAGIQYRSIKGSLDKRDRD